MADHTLAPCPFCGSEAKLTANDVGYIIICDDHDCIATTDWFSSSEENGWPARNALEVMRRNWQEKLDQLNDLKSRGDLTRDWGECSLITTRQIVSDLDAALGPAAPTEASDE